MTEKEFLTKYPKPDKCPMSIEEWCDPLGYCWAFATAKDEGRSWDEEKNCPCNFFKADE
jgi:hypothetical protein